MVYLHYESIQDSQELKFYGIKKPGNRNLREMSLEIKSCVLVSCDLSPKVFTNRSTACSFCDNCEQTTVYSSQLVYIPPRIVKKYLQAKIWIQIQGISTWNPQILQFLWRNSKYHDFMEPFLLGSLWTSIIKPGVFLSGGSGGVYALIMSHLATVIMNYR